MNHACAYTVKVPAQWVGINSARAQTYLREFFIHPLALPPDPGAGERVLRLTLNERQVDALARGSGDVPAVALRRLLATRIRELPAASSAVPESRAIVRAHQKPLSKSWAGGSLPIPEWFDSENPNREYYWRSLGADYQRQQIAAHRSFEGERMSTRRKAGRQFLSFGRVMSWATDHWLALFVGAVVLVVVSRKLGWFTATADATANAAPAFPLWTPE